MLHWDKKGTERSFLSPSIPIKNQSKLTFLDNNFPVIVIKKNVIAHLNIKDFCSIFNYLDAPSTANFSASQESHRFHQINELMEILKYFTDYFHYKHKFMDFMNLMGGYKERDKYERETNN